MDINIEVTVLEDGRVHIEFSDKREASLIQWSKEIQYDAFIKEITDHICSTTPSVANTMPIGFTVETKKLIIFWQEKNLQRKVIKTNFRGSQKILAFLIYL